MSIWGSQPLPRGVLPPASEPVNSLMNVLPAVGWALSEGSVDLVGKDASLSAASFGLETASPTVIIMVDGLGLNQVLEKSGYTRTLRSLGSEPVVAQTCAPSTTSAALTAFATGALPAQTNMVGYSVARGEGTMNLIQFKSGVDARAWQPVPTYFERFSAEGITSAVITDPKFAGSGLTNAAMRGPTFVPALTLPERFEKALQALRLGTQICYVYWAAIDKAGHKHGPESHQWSEALEDFDSALGQFLKKLPRGVQVILSADHGMIQVRERVDIAQTDALKEGVRILAGEGRAAHVHAEPGQEQAVLARWRAYWGDQAWVFGPEDFAEVLGHGPGLELVGAALVMPKGQSVVVDSRTQPAAAIAMKGVHGSLTADEMQIPVWRLA